MPIEPITQEQFKTFFTPMRGPRGSLWDRIQSQTVETRWYQYPDKNRIGIIIYDGIDNDWSCVTLEDTGEGYGTHEVKVSIQTEKEAVEVLMRLFDYEGTQTQDLTERINRQALANTGRTGVEILLETSEAE